MQGNSTNAFWARIKATNWMELIKKLSPFLGLIILVLAFSLIRKLTKQYSVQQVLDSMEALSVNAILGSLLATFVSYLVLVCYDLLAIDYVKKRVGLWKVVFTSFIAFTFSNNFGLANFAGNTVRIRFYSLFGLDAKSILQLIVFISFSFWTGFLALCGFLFISYPEPLPDFIVGPLWGIFFSGPPPEYLVSPHWMQALGLIAALFPLLYLVVCIFRWTPSWLRMFPIPHVGVGLLQILISAIEWALAGMALYLLLPDHGGVTFFQFLTYFATAQIFAFISHVPGGLGVIEATIIYFLSKDHDASAETVGAILAFRIIYYLIPMIIAVAGVVLFELAKSRDYLVRAMPTRKS